MARDKGQSKFSSNFEVKIAEMLDPRLLVDTKEELIKKETWPYDGDTLYMKEGMFVYVKGDGFYELVSLANILTTDYSGWKKVTSGEEGGSGVYFSDLLDEDAIMSIISGGAYQIEDTSKVEEFIANAKGKIVVFYDAYSSIVIPYIYFSSLYEGDFSFTYCGVNTYNDELGIWNINYSGGEFTINLSNQFSNYQPLLESGKTIKTINGEGVLGRGNITVQPSLISGTNIKTVNNVSLLGSGNINVQPVLQSGATIKTINGTSVLGGGNISVQSSLVSGTNIKTINGESVLGSGNIYIQTPLFKNTSLSSGGTHSLAWQNYYYFTTAISSDTIFSLPLPNSAGDPTGNNDARNYLNEILIEFPYTSGSISFPSTVKWQNETVPTFKSGYTYQISIVNNLACFAEFKTT